MVVDGFDNLSLDGANVGAAATGPDVVHKADGLESLG